MTPTTVIGDGGVKTVSGLSAKSGKVTSLAMSPAILSDMVRKSFSIAYYRLHCHASSAGTDRVLSHSHNAASLIDNR
jgi:hypothetical protein